MGPPEELRARLARCGQSHLLRFWAELGPAQRGALLAALPPGLDEHCRLAAAAGARQRGPPERLDGRMEPLPARLLGSVRRSDPAALERWEAEGLHQISQNKVAVLLLAGGQGTRLGVSYPKGMYNVGLPSGKTLYQIQAERIRKVEQLAGQRHHCKCTIPWYIMTSEFTLGPTEEFFVEHDYFNLDRSNVVMFEQRMLPAVTFDGKAILEEKGKIAMAPDGNGGLYCALVDNKILDDMKQRGIQKYEPQLRHHVAIKKVPYIDEEGNLVKPLKPNGIKLEKFVFDVFQFSKNFVAFEVVREEEFSPLKNADTADKDTPTTARQALLAQHYRWALKAGARFLDENGCRIPEKLSLSGTEDAPAVCEISPLVSYFGEGLEVYMKNKDFPSPFVLDENKAKLLGNS
ncbi:UDP-N-acetylhexosamine pyrophosphorylase-like protein 1 isoform X2 [Grus americana]|uniref:UDP-N-acetylhexosamine pyrophosphorylase-like protein 1 isoform X2 n=1 Tax=Grus americana TaxID=9117 RepID=UPI0024078FB4|nr:UDP-N-acetylhexosamine pyrophosphorylase-like protein 1 isoform X2 [Grus americana]